MLPILLPAAWIRLPFLLQPPVSVITTAWTLTQYKSHSSPAQAIPGQHLFGFLLPSADGAGDRSSLSTACDVPTASSTCHNPTAILFPIIIKCVFQHRQFCIHYIFTHRHAHVYI